MKLLMMMGMVMMGAGCSAQLSDPKWIAGGEGLGRRDGTIWGAGAYPASLPFREGPAAGVFGEKRFLTDMMFFDLAFSGKLGDLPFLMQVQREGNPTVSGNKFSLAFARSVHEQLDVGIRLGYNVSMANGYPATGFITAGIGSMFRCNEQLTIGFQADGINHFFSPELNRGYRFRAGAGYKLSPLFLLSVELLKEHHYPVATMMAIHYRFLDQAWTRMGYISRHNSFVCSAGFIHRGFETELFSTYHLSLGLSAGVSLMYRFKQDK
jgi:hypothetical protein